MKLLSKISEIVGKVLVTWTGLEPVIRAFVPDKHEGKIETVVDTILEVRNVIISIEEIAALSSLSIDGQEKLRIAGPLVGKVILQSALIADRKVKDEELFKKGSSAIASGMADILNSLDDDLNERNHG